MTHINTLSHIQKNDHHARDKSTRAQKQPSCTNFSQASNHFKRDERSTKPRTKINTNCQTYTPALAGTECDKKPLPVKAT